MVGAVIMLVPIAAAAFAGQWLARTALRVRGLSLPIVPIVTPGMRAAGRARRLAVRGCGMAAAYLGAALLFLGSALSAEVPTARIEAVPGYPAAAAGLRDGDVITRVDGSPVATFSDIRERTAASPGGPIVVEVERGGARQTFTLAPDAGGLVGLRPTAERTRVRAGAAAQHAAVAPVKVLIATGRTLASKAVGAFEARQVGGPLAVFAQSERRGSWWQIAALSGALAWLGLLLLEVLAAIIIESSGSGDEDRQRVR